MGGHGRWGWGWGGSAHTPQHNLGQLGTSPCITLTFGSSKGHVIVDGGVYVTDRDRGGEWVVRCVGVCGCGCVGVWVCVCVWVYIKE